MTSSTKRRLAIGGHGSALVATMAVAFPCRRAAKSGPTGLRQVRYEHHSPHRKYHRSPARRVHGTITAGGYDIAVYFDAELRRPALPPPTSSGRTTTASSPTGPRSM